jgi:hypothetical protein
VRRQGYSLAGISYDSPEILRAFSEKHSITFPLLSDPGSKTIAAWGLLNREATGRAVGVPHPGTFIVDRKGVIVSRAFEDAYQERNTAASILTRAGPSGASTAGATDVLGRYVTVRASASDRTAAPGHRLTLVVDVTPGPKMHVYAPGQAGYIPVELTLGASGDFKSAPARYPASRSYFFAPLKETVQVYDRTFQMTQDVTLALTPELRRRATAKETLTITGTLDYQACDDAVCYRPDAVALQWTIQLVPIER